MPRSGLVFRKEGDALVLFEQMPYMAGMPGTEAELAEYQDGDYESIKARFEAAGIPVRRAASP